MNDQFIAQIKASLFHLFASMVLITIVVGGIIVWFFPYPFWAIDDLSTALKVIICVDLVIGPLLTLILFKPGKKGLWFDMTTVLVLQISALAYGSWALYASRPAYLILYGDSFYLADHSKVNQANLPDPTLRVGPLDRPKIVSAIIPGSPEHRLQLALESLAEGVPVQFRAAYLTHYQGVSGNQRQHAVNRKNLPQQYQNKERFVVFNVVHHLADTLAVVDIDSGNIIDVITHAPTQ